MTLVGAAARLRSWACGPGGLTLALTAAIASAGAAAAAHLPHRALLPEPPLGGWAGLAVLAVALVVAELAQAHVEVRRQAYSFSLTGVPLLLGLLFCPPEVLVAVRVGAAALAFALQRVSPVKFAFNLGAYLLDVSLVVLVAHLLTGPREHLDVALALAVYAAMAVVDLLMTCLVLLVIRINSGPLEVVDVVDSVVPAVVFVVINVATGLLVALLAASGALGWTLLAAVVVLVAAVYRVHLVLRRRHASLQVVKDFVDLGAHTAAQGGELAEVLLGRLRTDVRAERASILVPAADDGDGEGGWTALAQSQEDDAEPTLQRTGRRAHDTALVEAALAQGGTLVGPRTGDRLHQQWLAAHGLREAMACPVEVEGRRGLVVVADRLGDTATFGRDDLSLLQTLAGHLEVALRSAWLVDRLRHDARHDPLTGLPNLLGLSEQAAAALASDRPPAVLVLSLDRADEVNAVLGHRAGDELLVLVARRLELALPGALVGRLSGWQFAVVLPTPEGGSALDDALLAAGSVERALDAPVQLTSTSVSTAASTGVALAQPGDDLGDALRRADTARTSRRADGPVVYTSSMDEGRAERVELLADLRGALDGDELSLHFQPKLDLASGLVTSVESLVRWEHPRLGRLAPDLFVPLAESTALIDPFTHHLLGKALHQCRTWQDQGIDLSVAVNLSARNVQDPSLPERVAAALARAGVPASRLTLEMTESSLAEDPARTIEVLERLAAIGTTISLDDFGTGYSSLSYLQRLPVQELKIDKSFVRGLEASSSAGDAAVSAALIRSITALKDALGLRVVAEGVEDLHVLERLRELGCDTIQGYVISRPLPADQLDASTFRWHAAPGATAR
ncbi:putative bifunctional diguanylate cyclase/phosphodiesterase [Quadrisphaera setariae]|uniref:Sensor domain-containing phosphodiesterase n=1 Tax=Quadrisphaera setariae TaxID=2593304 RepID=A0A5C8ZML2_9ACTN|nr:sensor domain-containing phosphodiesterase [Quadrisphaera setariae]TXR58030.1 sensor domain-containing phosphodiesterase [Quadrisphaera setariae]